jgi:hypothetical protein
MAPFMLARNLFGQPFAMNALDLFAVAAQQSVPADDGDVF